MREDWEIVKLGKFATNEKGKKPVNQKTYQDQVFKYPYVNIAAFEKGIIETYTDGEKCRLCFEDDFLMVWDGSRSGLVGKGMNGALGSTIVRINFPGIENDYAYYFLSSKYQEINTRAKGSGTPHVDPYLLWNYDFSICSIPEQRAIVAKKEELFSDLDKGIADLKKAQDQLVTFRQAVLKKAFEGELKKKWREQNKIKFNWKQTTTGEVMPDISSGSTPKSEFLSHFGEIQFLKVYNLNFDGSLNEKKNPAFIPNKIHKNANKRAITKAGDVLINIVGPPLGKTSMIPLNCKLEFNINQAIVRFRPNERIIAKFLCFFMQNPETVNWLEGTSKATAGQYNVKVTTCRVVPIALPEVIEQQQIVLEIESRLSVCDNVELSISESLEKAKALRHSILKKAFEGTLLSVAEIAKCKAAKDYEPASVLLEKIKAEKKE